MTDQTQADPHSRADLERLAQDARQSVLDALPRDGTPITDMQIASRCGLMLGATLMHLRTLERLGLVVGRGEAWRRL